MEPERSLPYLQLPATYAYLNDRNTIYYYQICKIIHL